MPGMEDKITQIIVRGMNMLGSVNIKGVFGNIETAALAEKPYVAVLNHNQRLEALIVPAALLHLRNGYPIHFLADWNFMIMPGVATMYRHSQVILVTKKDIKPRFLNPLRNLWKRDTPPNEQALHLLKQGASVGVFVESTINRDPSRLMRGVPGAAKMALDAGVDVLPIGIRFPNLKPGKPIPDGAAMTLHIGERIAPVMKGSEPDKRDVLEHHTRIMEALAEVSGKTWNPKANKRRRYVP